MIKLYFDGQEIKKENYRSLTQSNILFDNSFYLGSVPSNTFKIELNNKANIGEFEHVKVELDDEDYAHVYYDNLDNSNDNKSIISLSDAMVDFEFNYDASSLIETSENGYVTILEILEDICSKIGVTLATKNFNLKDKQVTWYDNTITARQYISFIATLNGGFAKMNRKGELELVQYTNDIKYEINANTCASFKIGEYHKITRVVWDTGVEIWEFGDETGNTLYLDTDNPFITEKEDVESIFNLINGFEFYSMEISKCPIDNNIDIGDIIAFKNGDKLYPFIAQIDWYYNAGFHGGYKFVVNTEKVEETSSYGIGKKIKSITSKINRDEATLEIIAKETKGNSEKISSLNMSVDKIGLKVEKLEDDKAVTGASIIMKINEEESEIAINADKLKLEGYTTINEGFGVDLDGNAFMNGATINGGNIEMLDDGKEDEHSIRLYKKSNIEEKTRILQVGEDIGGKTLTLTFPDGFEGTYLGSSIAYDNIIECENGFIRYQHGYMTSESYQIWLEYNPSPNVEITYIDMFIDYYEDGVHNIQTNEKTIIVPEGFGKIKSMNANLKNEDSNKPLYEYILYSYKEVKYATEFNSNGVLIKKDNIQASYQGNGMEISDTKGKRSFNTNGINWMTPYGYDFAEFTVNNEALIYSSGSQFLIDFMGSDASNHNLELIIDNETALRVTKNGIQAPNVETWQSDKRLKENIQDSDYKALDIVKRIRHRKFKFKDKEEIVAIGYVADELEELDENLIFEVGDKKIKHPKQSYIIPILSKAIQEQQIQIEELKQEINKLKEASK